MKRQPKNEKGNKQVLRKAETKRFAIIPTYHLLDTRLTMAEKGFYTKLYILPDKWKITQRATANYFNIETKTFNKYIKKLKDLGYIELKKNRKNETEYILNDKPLRPDFNIKYINNYTMAQLNYFLNSQEIEERYKNLIKKALSTAQETSDHFKKTLEEIEQETNENESESDYELPF